MFLSQFKLPELSCACKLVCLEIKAQAGLYIGHCKTIDLPYLHNATRLVNNHGSQQLNDIFQGEEVCDKALLSGDFIIHRKDDLFVNFSTYKVGGQI